MRCDDLILLFVLGLELSLPEIHKSLKSVELILEVVDHVAPAIFLICTELSRILYADKVDLRALFLLRYWMG